MKKLYFLLVFAIVFFGCNASYAQLVGGYGFLQGAFLEAGQAPNGSLGSDYSSGTPAPAGYHPHGFGGVAMVYDYGHDGWTVGTPPYMGDFTLPGTPFEGWEIQIGGAVSQSYYSNFPYGTTFTGTLAGSNTGYSNSGGVATVNWAGTAGPAAALQINMQTVIDTEGSAIVFTVHLINTTGAALPNVYYLRTCDPDNTESWSPFSTPPATWTGSFETYNSIVHQNEDATHRVLVTAIGQIDDPTAGLEMLPSAYLGLGTRDCRARCFIYNFWPLASSTDLSTVWSETYTPADFSENTTLDGDIGIGLVYNLGTIAGFDSAVISYAYIFNGVGRFADSGLENPGVFPDPRLLVEDSLMPTVPIPNRVYDTFDVCGHPGDDTVIVNILYSTTGNWTNSHWTWSPSTGLSSTTGTVDTIASSVLPPSITYTITGTDSSGPGTMLNCENRVFYLTILTCNSCVNNSPCAGDTLYLIRKGDSTDCTYLWSGPAGFSSTMQDPFIFPAVAANTGEYYVIRTLLGVHDTDSTNVVIHPLPVVTASSNSPLCTSPLGTLTLFATPTPPIAGEGYSWTGPGGFTSALEDPTISSFGPTGTGIYTVVTTTPFGCMDSATTDAELIPPPPAPVITGVSRYCQGIPSSPVPFVPFVVTDSFGTVLDSTILWYTVGTGGVGGTTPLTINTSVPGYDTVWVSRKIGACEGPRAHFVVHVVTTPAAPLVTGPMRYCQYDTGAYVPLTAHTTASGTANWYIAPSVPPAGASSTTQPKPNINVVPPVPGTSYGMYTYYVTQTDSSCQGPSTTVNIVIDRKPEKPAVHPDLICQYQTPLAESATPDSTNTLLWYGPGRTVATSTAPTPSTLVAPDTIDYYVTQTTPQGCVSDSALDPQIIIKKPAPPITSPVWYCQGATPLALNAEVDSSASSYLKWYISGVLQPSAPFPQTTDSTPPGNTTYYVTQTINTCESDSASIVVTLLYTPVFSINATQPYVCQYDSISLWYNGPQLVAPSYSWALPVGASFASGTHVYDDSIVVNFDSAVLNNYVYLTVSDDSGKCSTTKPIRINIVSQPTAQAYTKPDVCLGDTASLALLTRASDAYSYIWYIDYIQLMNSQSVTVIASNSNSGGPFTISWVDSGRHIVEVQTFSVDGCKSAPSYDTINVHSAPDAGFKITSSNQSGCIDDTVQFSADIADYNDSYVWSPAHSFENVNTPVAWGKIQEANTIITLTVTDPFGCTATQSMEIDPNSCCTVFLPNAFTPNGDGRNDFFRPIYNGYHHFHVFQIMNRWGQIIFTAENNNVQWDGNYNGVPQDMGVYYYYLKYDCGGKTIEEKGDVTLIR